MIRSLPRRTASSHLTRTICAATSGAYISNGTVPIQRDIFPLRNSSVSSMPQASAIALKGAISSRARVSFTGS